ncbi:MAG: thioredoxin [Candidatus Paceibacterota bacterium]|jgi:thioredoxin
MEKITDQNFQTEIKKFGKPVLVDFFAEWCAPCGLIGPVLERVAEKQKDKIDFLKINVDEFPLVSQSFGIQSIPAVILFKNGNPVSGFVGAQGEEAIILWLEKALSGGLEELFSEYEAYAKKNGLRLNPDKEIVKKILTGLLENEKKYGKRYCPCRRVTGDLKEDEKNICPCKAGLEEAEKAGHCLCTLFVK